MSPRRRSCRTGYAYRPHRRAFICLRRALVCFQYATFSSLIIYGDAFKPSCYFIARITSAMEDMMPDAASSNIVLLSHRHFIIGHFWLVALIISVTDTSVIIAFNGLPASR